MNTTAISTTAKLASAPKGPERDASAAAKAEKVLPPRTTATTDPRQAAGTNQAAEPVSQSPFDTVEVSPDAAALAPPAAEEEQDQEPSAQEEYAERMKAILDEAQGRVTSVTFQVFNEGGEVVVKIINKESGDVIRQIPTEEMQRLREKLEDMRGILFQEVS